MIIMQENRSIDDNISKKREVDGAILADRTICRCYHEVTSPPKNMRFFVTFGQQHTASGILAPTMFK